jgi:hypothetical protein
MKRSPLLHAFVLETTYSVVKHDANYLLHEQTRYSEKDTFSSLKYS